MKIACNGACMKNTENCARLTLKGLKKRKKTKPVIFLKKEKLLELQNSFTSVCWIHRKTTLTADDSILSWFWSLMVLLFLWHMSKSMPMYVAECTLWKKGWSSLEFLGGKDHSQATRRETARQNPWTRALSFLSYANNYPSYKMLLLVT